MYYLELTAFALTLTAHIVYAVLVFDARRPVGGHPTFRLNPRLMWGWILFTLMVACTFAFVDAKPMLPTDRGLTPIVVPGVIAVLSRF